MSYYIRVLSHKKENVLLRDICDHLVHKKINFFIDSNLKSTQLDNKNWKQFIITHNKEKKPLVLNRDVINAQKNNLVKEEIKEFLEEIENLLLTKEKKEIEKRLKQTNQIFSFQIPISDIDNNDWNLVDSIIDFLVEKTEGFVQADKEGFYINKKLVLKTK